MKNRHLILKSLLIVLLSGISMLSFAQTDPTDSLPDDPGAMSVTTVQNMKFGAFFQGAGGGTISISPSGSRSTTGSVTPINGGVTYYQASYEIEAPAGTIISIVNGSNATLTGSNGGSMTLQLDASTPVSPFTTVVQPPLKTTVNLGGTLTVGSPAASPPGSYSGTFYVTFNQE
jgi:hypothetical protein